VRAGVYVVIAAYNEESAVGEVIRSVSALYPNVVVVDDGSSDGTAEVAASEARFTLRHPINRGQGAALQTGIEFAIGRGARIIVTFDADGQHRVEDIAAMIAPIVTGEAEITLGSRFLGRAVNLPSSRRFVLRLAVLFTRIVNRMPLTDAHNGFRAFSRKAAGHINITADRMAHASEIIDQIRESGLAFKEVPVEVRYSEYSLAKGQSTARAVGTVFHYLMARVIG
jgi:glycosyltransferase involved in cell wall biosynthesis